MPQALPLPRGRFVQYLRTVPEAPRQEPARTHEIKGKKRHGVGVAYRLFGHHAVVLGRWTDQWITATEIKEIQEAGEDGWGRVIAIDEAERLRQSLLSDDRIREGWQPPVWHWRFYLERVVAVLNNLGLGDVQAYALFRWTPRRFVRLLYDRLKMRLFGQYEEPQAAPSVAEEHDDAVGS
jgi:hypothetical protein